MKKYKYVRMKNGIINTTYTYQGKGEATHREVIDEFATRGYRFVGTVPVKSDGYCIKEYDLVFEIEE